MPPDGHRVKSPTYVFRAFDRQDLPMMARWLAEPHVAEWWETPEVELRAVEAAMDDQRMRLMIVEMEGRPMAYLQIYDPHREVNHPYNDQPPGTLGIDLTIGPSQYLGQGHGGRMVRQLAEALFASGTPRLVIDPHPRNERAIRAYEKAGFSFVDRRDSIYGPAHLMALDAPIEETDMS